MRPPARAQRILPVAGLVLTLAVAGLLGWAEAPGATLVINVQSADGHPLPGAVVTVRPLDGQAHRAAPVHAVMDQVNRAFEPDLLVLPLGSKARFT
jgi:hypothetical protein